MFHRFSIHFHQHDHLHHCQQRHHWILGIHNHPKLCLPKLQVLVEIQFQNFPVPLLLVFSCFDHPKLCLPKLQDLVEIQFQNCHVPLLLVFSCFAPTSFLSSCIFQHQQQDLVHRLFQKEGFDFVQSRCDFCVLGHFCHFQCFLFLLLKQTSSLLCCSLPSGSIIQSFTMCENVF